jgi:hypothetical protein
MKEAQPGPRASHSGLRRTDTSTGALVSDEARDGGGTQSLELVTAPHVREELLRHTDVAPHAVSCKTALIEQVPPELAEEHLGRGQRAWRFGRNDTQITQVLDHRCHRPI